jgi:transposase
MKRFIQGEHRSQAILLPECLDDYITETNPVRVVDVFVDELNLARLGFDGVNPAMTGRPSYHPSILLKIYIYGYLNRIQSSRRLEREAQRNIELMWLTNRLAPDFKTIANFRLDNGKAIRQVCKQFIELCRRMHLFTEAVVAVDGSKFKAVNSRDKCFTQAKIKFRLKQVEAHINQYLKDLDQADQHESHQPTIKTVRLSERLAELKEQMQALQAIYAQSQTTPDKQVVLTDPDARFMATSKSGSGMVAYNVQTAVDTQHHLVVAHEVTNQSTDRGQLTNMSVQAQQAMGVNQITAYADKGYFNSEEILTSTQSDVIPLVPKPRTSINRAAGLYDRQVFIYQADKDEYRCPANQALIKRFTSNEKGKVMHTYWSSSCKRCALKSQCTPSAQRRIKRWEHEEVLDAMQSRLDVKPDAMLIRKQTVEHPFGTIKSWMGATHFQTRGLEKVSTEMSLHVLAYNLKRVINILGSQSLIQAMQSG